jgi:predicted NBD/HSP70 family sugar kinase
MRQHNGSGSGRAADQALMRRQNLSLVLRRLRDRGPQSRARLAEQTGLNKATISSLVAELGDRGLVADADSARGEVGRPAQLVRLSGSGVCALGAELDVGQVAVEALDLDGRPIVARRASLSGPQASPEEALDALTRLVREVLSEVAPRAVVGLTVAVPGLVEQASGSLLHAPNLGWSRLPLADLVAVRIRELGLALHVENEANLAVLAESAARRTVPNIVLITGSSGVGAGIVVEGRLRRGAAGYGGEVGHMPVELQGALCRCGRRGCWETRVGLSALLNSLAEIDDPVLDPSLDPEQRLAEVVRRAESGDARTLNALEQVGTWLGVGAATIASVLDPDLFILGGYFAPVARWLQSPMNRELRRRAIGADGRDYDVEVSSLGFEGTLRGAVVNSLESVFDDPTTIPRKQPDQMGA